MFVIFKTLPSPPPRQLFCVVADTHSSSRDGTLKYVLLLLSHLHHRDFLDIHNKTAACSWLGVIFYGFSSTSITWMKFVNCSPSHPDADIPAMNKELRPFITFINNSLLWKASGCSQNDSMNK